MNYGEQAGARQSQGVGDEFRNISGLREGGMAGGGEGRRKIVNTRKFRNFCSLLYFSFFGLIFSFLSLSLSIFFSIYLFIYLFSNLPLYKSRSDFVVRCCKDDWAVNPAAQRILILLVNC